MKPMNWKIVDDQHSVLTCTYSFGAGLSTALAVGVDGGTVLVSPPSNPTEEALEAIASRGKVRALIASNAYHHMGLGEWKKRFPEAQIFAPAQSVGRVSKQSQLSGIRSLAEMGPLGAERVQFIDLPHFKTGEVFVTMKTGLGETWYVTDILFNMPKLPPNPIAKALFSWTNSAPGLKYNNLASFIMVKDKKAMKSWLAKQVESAPPARVLFAHGATLENGAAELAAIFA